MRRDRLEQLAEFLEKLPRERFCSWSYGIISPQLGLRCCTAGWIIYLFDREYFESDSSWLHLGYTPFPTMVLHVSPDRVASLLDTDRWRLLELTSGARPSYFDTYLPTQQAAVIRAYLLTGMISWSELIAGEPVYRGPAAL